MIKIRVEPIDREYLDELGEATVSLDVSSNTETGLPKIESEHPVLPKAIGLKVLIAPSDKYGHIVDPNSHSGPTLMHCLNVWNEMKAYRFIFEEGEALVKPPAEKPLPKGAIP